MAKRLAGDDNKGKLWGESAMPLFILPFPAINPVALSLGPILGYGPFVVKWYGLAYIAGLLLGWGLTLRLVRLDRLWGGLARPDQRQVDDLLLYVALGVVLGGRIGYITFYDPAKYLADPLEMLRVWHGGMAFHGGMVGSILGIWLFARRNGLRFLTLCDLVAAAVPIGLFFGRIANFINGELWGNVSDLPWAMVFPTGGPEARHPSQLYEAGLEGVVLYTVLAVVVRSGGFRRPGLVTGLFSIGYGLCRIAVEFVRTPDAQLGYLAFGFVTMGMILSLPMLAIGAALVGHAFGKMAFGKRMPGKGIP